MSNRADQAYAAALAEIAAIPHGGKRSKALLDYLAEQETHRLEAALEAR